MITPRKDGFAVREAAEGLGRRIGISSVPGTEIQRTGFDTVAEAPGCPGRRVERAAEPAGASPDALGHEGPFIPEIPLAAGEPSAHDSTAR